jgi:hypothetical protein
VSRSVRQTLALEAKLERDRQLQDRDDRDDARRAQEARVSRRKAQVSAAVERCIWSEAEGDEAERLLDDLADRLDEEALYEAFGEDPVAAHIARICADLGVTPPETAAVADLPADTAVSERIPAADRSAEGVSRNTWRSSA